jgi:uncharacterized protein YjbI with pentapeptide repeats
VKITLETLRQKGACAKGQEWFERLFPEGWEGEWTPMHQATMLADRTARAWWAWAVRERLIPAHSMAGCRLRGVDLFGADLRRADLRGADLRRANLEWVDLRRADLRRVDLRGANLEWADLRGANLCEANLEGVDLVEWERGPDGFARKKEVQQ